jgi:hypothetical protein
MALLVLLDLNPPAADVANPVAALFRAPPALRTSCNPEAAAVDSGWWGDVARGLEGLAWYNGIASTDQ